MYKAIIFDFFDVIHSDPYHAWMRKHNFTRQGSLAEASRQLDRGNTTMKQFYEELSKTSGVPTESIESDFHTFSHIDHRMVEFAKKIHTSYKTALLSNAESAFLRTIIDKHQLESLFDVIVISSEVQLIKPEPEVFLHMLEKLGTNAHETIFIDDNENNIKAAQTLGITGLHYRDLPTLQNDLAKLV